MEMVAWRIVWLCASVAWLMAIAAEDQKPHRDIKITGGNVHVTFQQHVLMTCAVSLMSADSRVYNIWWSLNGTAITKLVEKHKFGEDVFKNRLSTNRPLREAQLQFEVISFDQNGWYRCHANTDETREDLKSEKKYVTIMPRHRGPQFHTSQGNWVFVEGEPLKLTCAYYGTRPLWVRIFRNGTKIASSEKEIPHASGFYPLVEAVYHKDSASLADNGEYVCEGRNLLRNEAKNVTLRVIVKDRSLYDHNLVVLPPRVLTGEKKRISLVQLEVGENMEHYFIAPEDVEKASRMKMTCKAIEWANKPILKWHYNNQSIIAKVEQHSMCKSEKGVCFKNRLVILEMNQSVYGVRFTCKASLPEVYEENRSVLIQLGVPPKMEVERSQPDLHRIKITTSGSPSPEVYLSFEQDADDSAQRKLVEGDKIGIGGTNFSVQAVENGFTLFTSDYPQEEDEIFLTARNSFGSVNDSVLIPAFASHRSNITADSQTESGFSGAELVLFVLSAALGITLVLAIILAVAVRRRKEQPKLDVGEDARFICTDGNKTPRPVSLVTKDSALNLLLGRKHSVTSSRYGQTPTLGSPKTDGHPSPIEIGHEWQFPLNRLIIREEIGQGAFGLVYRGEAIGIDGKHNKSDVAVKICKDESLAAHRDDLQQEIRLLISLADQTHKNVIKFLGVCTHNGAALIMIMEYAALGNLLKFLRARRAMRSPFSAFTSKSSSKNSLGTEEDGKDDAQTPPADLITNFSSGTTNNYLRPKDFCQFAQQISNGMTFLTSNNIVHRDLAARNILISSTYELKISDFGQSRSVSTNEMIYKRRPGKQLPVRWHAPESLFDGVYTAQSDVWSFGIVLWEIATLGCSPYPGIPVQKLFSLLQSGWRMEKPEACPQPIYDIMLMCWKKEPALRPKFKELCQKFTSLSQNVFKTDDALEYLVMGDSVSDTSAGEDEFESTQTPPESRSNSSSAEQTTHQRRESEKEEDKNGEQQTHRSVDVESGQNEI